MISVMVVIFIINCYWEVGIDGKELKINWGVVVFLRFKYVILSDEILSVLKLVSFFLELLVKKDILSGR